MPQHSTEAPRPLPYNLTLEGRLDHLQQSMEKLTSIVRQLSRPSEGLRLCTFQGIAEAGPFSVDTLRHWQRTRSDFQPCLIQQGRRLYVDMDAFERWLDRGRAKPVPGLPTLSRRNLGQTSRSEPSCSLR